MTVVTGGVSIKIKSNPSVNLLSNSWKFVDAISSDGFGGIGPEVRTYKFSICVSFMASV